MKAVKSLIRKINFLATVSLLLVAGSSFSAHAGERSDAARFPILHDDMSEYWSMGTAQQGRSSSAVNTEGVSVRGEAGVQNGQGASHGTASSGSIFSGRQPQNVDPAAPPPHRCENGKKKDLPAPVSPHSDPAS